MHPRRHWLQRLGRNFSLLFSWPQGAFAGVKKPRFGESGLFPFCVDSHTLLEENSRESPLSKEAALFRKRGMYHPPPLRGRPVLVGRKVLLIDRNQPTRDVRARVLQSHGVEVHAAEDLSGARQLESYF